MIGGRSLLLGHLLCLFDDLLFLDLVWILLGQRFCAFNWLSKQEPGAGGRFLQFVENRSNQLVALAAHGADLETIEVRQ